MTRHVRIKSEDIEIEKVGDIVRVDIKDFGVYEQVGDVYEFTHEVDCSKDSNIAYVISKILEVL